jgi:methylglyoxal synthase
MQKMVALIAHDHKKPDLVKWCLAHKAELSKHKLVATGTTGGILQQALNLDIHCFKSGPLGGDQQVGALIA